MRGAGVGLAALVMVAGCQGVGHVSEGVTLRGTARLERYYGSPNYGENPESDRIEEAEILRLDKPLAFRGSDGNRQVVSEVQVIGFGAMADGARVTCRGRLDEAISGHHRRAVLLVANALGGAGE